uniref:Uncharacterized protein n=1 Tax=Anguilla anguilla TaxID=7936 RepID=A0A0E9V6F5_ANGAN
MTINNILDGRFNMYVIEYYTLKDFSL